MNDFITNIIYNHAQTTSHVRPRIRSRFEPEEVYSEAFPDNSLFAHDEMHEPASLPGPHQPQPSMPSGDKSAVLQRKSSEVSANMFSSSTPAGEPLPSGQQSSGNAPAQGDASGMQEKNVPAQEDRPDKLPEMIQENLSPAIPVRNVQPDEQEKRMNIPHVSSPISQPGKQQPPSPSPVHNVTNENKPHDPSSDILETDHTSVNTLEKPFAEPLVPVVDNRLLVSPAKNTESFYEPAPAGMPVYQAHSPGTRDAQTKFSAIADDEKIKDKPETKLPVTTASLNSEEGNKPANFTVDKSTPPFNEKMPAVLQPSEGERFGWKDSEGLLNPPRTSGRMPGFQQVHDQQEQPQSRPIIKVTIGRIEVRAVIQPAPATPARSKPVVKPDMSLEDYLNQRNKPAS